MTITLEPEDNERRGLLVQATAEKLAERLRIEREVNTEGIEYMGMTSENLRKNFPGFTDEEFAVIERVQEKHYDDNEDRTIISMLPRFRKLGTIQQLVDLMRTLLTQFEGGDDEPAGEQEATEPEVDEDGEPGEWTEPETIREVARLLREEIEPRIRLIEMLVNPSDDISSPEYDSDVASVACDAVTVCEMLADGLKSGELMSIDKIDCHSAEDDARRLSILGRLAVAETDGLARRWFGERVQASA